MPGPASQINVADASHSGYPLAAATRGGFVVAWTGREDGAGYGVTGRAFDRVGLPQGGEFRVNAYTTGVQAVRAVAADPSGDTLVIWTGTAAGPMARRFVPDVIFRDGFEGGRLTAWSASAIDGGDLRATLSSALAGSVFGLQATVDDAAPLYVEDAGPADESRYRIRFHFDPNGFDPGEAQGHFRTRLFIAFADAPLRRLAVIVLRRIGGAYAVMARTRLDDGTRADTGFFAITDEPHWIELDWQRSSGAEADDGRFVLSVDGAIAAALTGLDNDAAGVDLARLGALTVKAGASGTLYWDEFESRRATEIGP